MGYAVNMKQIKYKQIEDNLYTELSKSVSIKINNDVYFTLLLKLHNKLWDELYFNFVSKLKRSIIL
jgi:hypothetical protein